MTLCYLIKAQNQIHCFLEKKNLFKQCHNYTNGVCLQRTFLAKQENKNIYINVCFQSDMHQNETNPSLQRGLCHLKESKWLEPLGKNGDQYCCRGNSTACCFPLFHEIMYSLECDFKCLLAHVSEAYPKPSRFRAMARRAWRYIQLHFVKDRLPKSHFTFSCWCLQQWT